MSKQRSLTATLLITLVSVAGIATFAPADEPSTRPTAPAGERRERAPAERGPGERRPGGQAPNLEQSMKAAERTLKAINRQIDDPSQDAATLAQVDQLQRALAASKCIVPDEVNELTGDEKTKEIASYRALMLKSLKTAIALEDALIAGDRPAAKAALKSLADQRKEGHEEYGVDDHDH